MVKCDGGAKTDHTINSCSRDHAIGLGMDGAPGDIEAVAAKSDKSAETQRESPLIAAPGLPDLRRGLNVAGTIRVRSVGSPGVNRRSVRDAGRRRRRCHHGDRKSTRLNSSHVAISYAVFCLKKKNNI